jgi:hypothetical protein
MIYGSSTRLSLLLIILALIFDKLDHVIDPKNSYRCFSGKLANKRKSLEFCGVA